jgi:hypothetical protein
MQVSGDRELIVAFWKERYEKRETWYNEVFKKEIKQDDNQALQQGHGNTSI